MHSGGFEVKALWDMSSYFTILNIVVQGTTFLNILYANYYPIILLSTLGCAFQQTAQFRAIRPSDLVLHLLHTWAVYDWLISVFLHAGHFGYKKHSRRSCSMSRHKVWPGPP